jgi:5-methylcytosine-specific restriction endonuclease McrA
MEKPEGEIERPLFVMSVSPEQFRKEKEKAKELRGTQWWKRQLAKGCCHYCRRKVPPAELTMDHIVALARGGKSTRGNTVPACKECNSRKKYLLPVEWDEYIGGFNILDDSKNE